MSLSLRRSGADQLRRPDPFALPTPVVGRSLLLVIAVVGASLFTYDFMYIAIDSSPGHADTVWMIGGLLALLLVTGAIYLSMPTWLIRRRRLALLTPDDAPELHEEIAGLAREAGLPRPPILMVDALNPSASALVFGLPRHRRLRLNGGLVTLYFTDVAGFRSTVRHEMAHLRNRDVDQTYLAIAVWYAFVLTALAPLIVTMLVQPGLDLLGVAWRAVALTIVVRLFRNAVLRTREYTADARALQWDGPHGALRQTLAASTTSGEPVWRQWSFGPHPPATKRQSALDDEGVVLRLGFWDAVGVGVACTIATSSVLLLLRSIVEQPDALEVRWIAALFFAPLAAAGLTVGMWRGALFRRSAGLPPPGVVAPGVGLGCGLILGEPLSLPASITGVWGPGPAPAPQLAVIVLIVLFAATVLVVAWIRCCALAWAPSTAALSRWVVGSAVVASALVLTSLLSSWTLLRDLHQLIPAMTGQAAHAYAALPATQFSGPLWLWMGIEHPMLLKFVHQDVALVVVVLLWLFPLAGLLWSRPRSRSRGGHRVRGCCVRRHLLLPLREEPRRAAAVGRPLAGRGRGPRASAARARSGARRPVLPDRMGFAGGLRRRSVEPGG